MPQISSLKTKALPYFFLTILFASPLISSAQSTLTVIGDSVTEGYGVAKESSYVSLVEKELKGWKVTNAGISGSTSASAPGRMKWALKAKPTAVLLALGGNDGLRALKTAELKKNLVEAIELAKKAGVKVLLAGYEAPPNYGAAYTKGFRDTFTEIAKEQKVPLYPFILDGVAGDSKLNLADGIHPNVEGHKVLAKKILPWLQKELK
jgi:acyl-CoA thioesterase-1